MEKHYFHAKLVDGTKPYKPESQIVLDLATAYNFFGRNPERTKDLVVRKVHDLTNAWNKKFFVEHEVKIYISLTLSLSLIFSLINQLKNLIYLPIYIYIYIRF